MTSTSPNNRQTYISKYVATTNEEKDVPRKRVEVELAQHTRAEHDELWECISTVSTGFSHGRVSQGITMNINEMMPKSPKVALVTENDAHKKIVSSVIETTTTWRLLICCF